MKCNPNLTLKNVKKQTPIDISNSKIVISVFWKYLTSKTNDIKASFKPKTNTKNKDQCTIYKKGKKSLNHSQAILQPKNTSKKIMIRSMSTECKLGLDSFTPIQLLGKGSFGKVFLVKENITKKLFAMKIVLKSIITERNISKYIYAERNVQSKINHPFITKLYCTFQSKSAVFMVTEYCPGGDLRKLLRREKRLTEDIARIYISEILLAIEELHSKNIIYRDLKPDNIALNDKGHIKLTDFGLSKEGMKCDEFTRSFCGSIAYLAPEMIRKSGHSKSIDWYLLGVVMYEMIMGTTPYFNKDKYT